MSEPPGQDPVAGRVPGQELLYGAIQSVWSAVARRRRAVWTPAQVAEVERRAGEYPFLAGYSFDPEPETEPGETARARSAWVPPSKAACLGAWLNPRAEG